MNVITRAATQISSILIVLLSMHGYGQSVLPGRTGPTSTVGSTAGSSSATTADGQRTAAVRFGADGLVFSNEAGSDQLKGHGFVQGDGRFFASDSKDKSPDRQLWRR